MTEVHWRSLASAMSPMDEQEVKRLLEWELANQRRLSIVKRLHQRFTRLRAARERAELMARLRG